MATLRKIGRNYFGYFYDPVRSPKRKSVPLRTGLKSAAQRRLTELEYLFYNGEYDPWTQRDSLTEPTLDVLGSQFLESKADLRPKTLVAYGLVLKSLKEQLGESVPISRIDSSALRKYLLQAS